MSFAQCRLFAQDVLTDARLAPDARTRAEQHLTLMLWAIIEHELERIEALLEDRAP